MSKRIRNIKCNEVCVVCDKEAVYHHVKSFGSGGKTVTNNLLPLCVEHHHQIHYYGLGFFASGYQSVFNWLMTHGWEFDKTRLKWVNYSV